MSLAILFLTASCSHADTIDLAKTNSPPTEPSVPSGPTSGSSGAFYSYVTKSTDPDGDQVKYTLDWGDGTASTTCFVNQGTAIRVFHKWTVSSGSENTFNVRVKATDRYGLASHWSSPLSVTISGSSTSSYNNPPSNPSTPLGSTSGSSGTSYGYSTKAIDPEGNKVKYTFNWGDGTASATSYVSSGASASASHIWTVDPGSSKTFSVSAKATDESGKESSWSSPLSVTIKGPAISNENNPPTTPSVPYGPTTGSPGISYSYTTKATDPDGDQIRYTFDWGDGTASTTCLIRPDSTIRVYHKWTVSSGSKTFDIRVRSMDEHGMTSSWSDPLSVTITNEDLSSINSPPAAPSVPSGSTSGSAGTSYSYSTKATDPDGDRVKYTFDWGDGITSVTYLVSSGVS